MEPSVLIVDDDAELCRTLEAGLTRRGFAARWCTHASDALVAVSRDDFDAVVADVRLPGLSGLALCERIAANRPDVPVVVMTAFGSMDAAIDAIRAGAYDFLTKPVEVDALALALRRASEHRRLRREVQRLRECVRQAGQFDRLLGNSDAMRSLFEQLARIAVADAPVLVVGETGTGKELVARALHARSGRKGPFVAINCAAVPETLLESELFGHEKGAFTGAHARHEGLFAAARGGTLLLDEIGDMPLSLQPKLLRALQERTIRPLGATREVAVDVRVIAATHCDLDELIQRGRFRADLYYRLAVLPVRVPPLRERGGDILLLAQRFLEQSATRAGKAISGLSPEAARRLGDYPWPGNIRELQNCIEHAVAMAQHTEILVEDLPEPLRTYRSWRSGLVHEADELMSLEDLERRYIVHVLRVTGGNKRRAAQILGLNRATLYRKLERYRVQ